MLEFSLGPYPIKVHFTFLLLGVIVLDSGYGTVGLIIWTAVAFVSILLHELGHAYAVRRTGALVDHIMLYAMGGLTFWNDRYGGGVTWRQRILISAAGPATGIVTGLAAYLALRLGLLGPLPKLLVTAPWNVALTVWAQLGDWAAFTAGAVVWISLVWGVVNLLPIGGLDGSHILGELLERKNPGRGRVQAAWIGITVAALAAYWTYSQGYTFAPLIFLFFAINDLARVTNSPRPFDF